MHTSAEKIFYSLSIFLLGTGLFLLKPTPVAETSTLQAQFQHEFSIAWQETIGDQPVFDELALIYEGISDFYSQAADSAVALIQQPEADRDIIYVYKTTYQIFAQAVSQIKEARVAEAEPVIEPEKFMTEAAVANIIPENSKQEAVNSKQGEVAGVSIEITEPANNQLPWVTLRDNFTGQLYCLAVYNGEVNKYLGACKLDYH